MAIEKHYDPDQLLVTVGGAEIVGWADGSFLTITRTTDAFQTVVGSTGEVVRSKSNDRRHRITIRLLQTSESNDLLSNVTNTDQNAPNGAGTFPLSIRHRDSGRAVYQAASAWVAKEPDVNYDRTAQPREWQFETGDLQRFDAGSD